MALFSSWPRSNGAFVVFGYQEDTTPLCFYRDFRTSPLCDVEADRQHPVKRLRPLATGVISSGFALEIAVALIIIGLAALLTLGVATMSQGFLYVSIATAYSLFLKRVVIVDVMALASGYVLRVIGGATAISIWISPWLLLCTGLLALFLGFEKRRSEQTQLGQTAPQHRAVLVQYSPHLLDQLVSVLMASTLMAYTLYTLSPETIARFHTNKLPLTVPFVLYGIFRYLYLVHRKGAGSNPAELVTSDLPFAVNLGLWAAVCVLIVYWPR
jgi:4-hydroxybenzoate polyprenyltransferase